MPADTALKRYSAMNIASPWRGLNVTPDATIPQGERQAVMFMYSGILAAVSAGSQAGGRAFIGVIQQMGDSGMMDTSMGQG